MPFRHFSRLAVVLAALGTAACSDGNDTPSGTAQGGSGGSNAGTGGGGSSPGGAPTSASPKVGLQLSLHEPDPPMPNTECFPAGMSAIGDPPPSLNPLSRGEGLSNGDSDVTAVCSVTGPDTFSLSATIRQGDLRFKVSDGTIDAAAGTGTFELLVETVEAGDIVTEVEQPCTLDVSEPPLEVSEGNLFATFDCPLLWNHATATDTACGAEGALLLEDCQD